MRLLVAAGLFAGLSAVALAQEVGPHNGPAAEWGAEEYHLEILPDAKTGVVTVYVYGNDDDLKKGKKKAIDSKSLTLVFKTTPPVTVKLEPAPEKDDPAGKATKFTGKSDKLDKLGKLEGTISGKVGNKPYTGDFKQK
jgi:hypothetical protein